MSPDDRDATGADDGADRAEPTREGAATAETPPADEPSAYRPGWRERVIGWLFAVFVVVFVLWRLIPVLLAALLCRVVQTLVYLALFGRRDQPRNARADKPSDEANALRLDSYADLYSGGVDRAAGATVASVLGALIGGAAFCGVVALAHGLLTAPVLWDALYGLWLLFVAFPLGATLGSVSGRAARRWRQGEWAPAREIAERGGTGIAVGMVVAMTVTVAYALAVCGGDPDCIEWYLTAELPIYLFALAWGLALRRWGVSAGNGR
jgi:hypothetical protein